ncbi:hypothetical protein AB0F81_29720 [Actinoplanes sp. NPDC024001]|uniref:hypothetical protein n=1 Tax=Actinoplanes sp. NPDC024001 TaxID=3154598 RepID=UPI003406CEEC
MIWRLYERLTARPWKVTRSVAVEFGPPPGARYYRPSLTMTADMQYLATVRHRGPLR